MGTVACCRKPDNEEEKNLERNQLYSSLKILDNNKIGNNNINNNKNFNNLNLFSEQASTLKYNNYSNNYKSSNINEENSINEEKIKKIQRKYRSYHQKNKFQNEIRPIINKKTTDFVNKFYQQCEKGGEALSDDDFSPEGWKKYYPSDEEFFLYPKGKVFENQIRIKNADDQDNIEIYEGETDINNLKHGFGTLTTPHYILKGSWRNDEFTGWGRKSMRNGDVFEGKFINGELNGKGIFKSKGNNIYVGDFVNSQRSGKGKLITDKYNYIGEFKNDELNGYGVIDFLDEGQRYEGNFENNEINGKGIYKWKNGDIYEGEMKKGKMDGYGKYSYTDGKIYEGEYVNGIKQGRGKLTYPNNKIFEGIFENGKPNGEGFYTKDGHTSKVLFSNGEFIKVIA